MSAADLHIGVDIGGTNIKIGVIDDSGSIRLRRSVPTNAQCGPEALIQLIGDTIADVLDQSDTPISAIRNIGVGVPGTADTTTGTVLYAPNIFWRNVAVGPALASRFGSPVYLAQDTRAAAWAEYLVGERRGTRHLAAVTLGTGVGCGLVLDGTIFHGGLNTAGEFGHQIVAYDGDACNCGRRGCLEAHAGGLAIVRQAELLLPATSSAFTVDEVYRLSLENEPSARKLTEDVVKFVGIGLVNLINLTSVEVICLSGGISNAPSALLLDPLIAFVRANAYNMIASRVHVCRSALGDDAPLIGASLLYRALAQTTCNA